LGIVLLLFWAIHNTNTGPYSGTYDFKQDVNWSLKISDNHTFVMHYNFGKNGEFIKGHYTVDNDNNITLVSDKDNVDKFITETLTGKVMGSTIKLTSMEGEFIKE
jgi:hypothetical protein